MICTKAALFDTSCADDARRKPDRGGADIDGRVEHVRTVENVPEKEVMPDRNAKSSARKCKLPQICLPTNAARTLIFTLITTPSSTN